MTSCSSDLFLSTLAKPLAPLLSKTGAGGIMKLVTEFTSSVNSCIFRWPWCDGSVCVRERERQRGGGRGVGGERQKQRPETETGRA